MAIIPEDPMRDAKESTKSVVEIGRPALPQILYQAAETDIEHIIVKDDPRNWGDARKVSRPTSTLCENDLLIADCHSHYCLRRLSDDVFGRQHTKP
jgi:hypothetical protein